MLNLLCRVPRAAEEVRAGDSGVPAGPALPSWNCHHGRESVCYSRVTLPEEGASRSCDLLLDGPEHSDIPAQGFHRSLYLCTPF